LASEIPKQAAQKIQHNLQQSKALFLDRDGTITKEIPVEARAGKSGKSIGGTSIGGTSVSGKENLNFGYVTEVEQVELIAGSADAIAKARKLGYKIIIITNQSAIARGWLTEEKLEKINQRMYDLLNEQNPDAIIDDLFYSPYHTDGVIEKYRISSPYRKPGIAMITDAGAKHNINLNGSYLIGDSYSDIKCGLNAGIKTILVLTGYGKTAYKKCLDEKLKINFIANNLSEAVKYIEENDA
jgi:D-glycero-D-manno-heptose 1,7-bisphosphate phosphatase